MWSRNRWWMHEERRDGRGGHNAEAEDHLLRVWVINIGTQSSWHHTIVIGCLMIEMIIIVLIRIIMTKVIQCKMILTQLSNQIQYSQQYRRVMNKNGVMGTCEMCLSSCASHEQHDTVGEVRHDNSMSLVTIFTQTKTQTWDWHLAAGMQTPEYLPSSYNTSLVVNKYYFPEFRWHVINVSNKIKIISEKLCLNVINFLFLCIHFVSLIYY